VRSRPRKFDERPLRAGLLIGAHAIDRHERGGFAKNTPGRSSIATNGSSDIPALLFRRGIRLKIPLLWSLASSFAGI